jgi:hypothetical protein
MRISAADRQWIEERGYAAGFDRVGMASVPPPQSDEAAEEERRFTAWIDAGHAGGARSRPPDR